MFRAVLLVSFCFSTLVCPPLLAGVSTPASIQVSTERVASGIEALGANMTTLAGGTNLLTNNLIWNSGMEPGVARYLVRVERTGPGWIEWDQSLGGVHQWDTFYNNFGDGAKVRLYRIVDAEGKPLSYLGGTELHEAAGAHHVVFLGETSVPAGGWIANGSGEGKQNRVLLSNQNLALAYGDHAIITVSKNKLPISQINPRLHDIFTPEVNLLNASPGNVTAELVPHPGVLPADFSEPGDTCLKLGFPEGGSWAGQWLLHGHDQAEGSWYSQLEPNSTYRAEVWLRQQGMASGQVRFMAGGSYANLSQQVPWTVTGEWQRFVYDFTSGSGYPNPADGMAVLGLEALGGGTLWVDNFLVYRYDAAHGYAPFTPNQTAFDELMAAMPQQGPKPALRFYNTTYAGHSPMKRLLSNYPSSRIDFIYNISASPMQTVTVPQALAYALATGASKSARAIPYITLAEEYTEDDWLALMEYLGVPYDPAQDDPSTKPWAYLRYQQRGIGTAWTDEFREIVIEFGNETWHAGVMSGWDGFGRPGYVHLGGREYGLFANYYFGEVLANHPWWNEYGLGRKIRFSLNANYEAKLSEWGDSYGEAAAQAAPDITSYLGHANYVGPKWETGEEPFQTFDAHGMQETLMGGYLTMFPVIDSIDSVRQQLSRAGLADYRPIAYEGGPSGYYVPGNGNDAQVAITEQYGKSLGMAVSALDTWLYSSLKGYAHQEYFAYFGGTGWTSHTMPNAGGFRRHAGWLALMLRNLYAPGKHMLRTSLSQLPSYVREGQELPLMSAYSIDGGDRISVFVLSRKYPGEHDGANFGDGKTPTTLQIPLTACSAITRYALTAPDGSTAHPMDSNTDQEKLVISGQTLPANDCDDSQIEVDPASGGVPPGNVYLYVFEESPAPGCSGEQPSLREWEFPGLKRITCQGQASLSAGPGVTVRKDAEARLRAPLVRLLPGFAVEAGGKLEVGTN